MGPIREHGPNIKHLAPDRVRPIKLSDFEAALRTIRPSVTPETIQKLEQWNAKYGCTA